MMAQSRGALIRLANGLSEKGQQLQDELNILKHEFEMILEQRNYIIQTRLNTLVRWLEGWTKILPGIIEEVHSLWRLTSRSSAPQTN